MPGFVNAGLVNGGLVHREMRGPIRVPASGVPFDVILNFSSGSGAATATKLNAGTHGAAWGTWHDYHEGNPDVANDHANIANHAVALPFQLLVAAALYDGSEGQGLTFDHSAIPTTYDAFQFNLSATVSDCISLYLARFDTTLDGGDPQTYGNDTVNMAGSNYTVSQYRHQFNGEQGFNCHSEGDNGLEVDYPGGWVIICARHNVTGNIGEFFVQDNDTLAVIGSSQSEHATPAGNLSYVRLQDYLRGVSSTGAGSIKVKLLAFRNSDLTWPPYSITVPAPTSVVAAQSDVGEVTLTWSSPCQIIKIERNLNAGGWATLVALYNNNGVGSYVDSAGLSDGDSVQYRVSAVIGAQVSSTAASGTVTIDDAAFAVPTWSDAIAVGSTDTNDAFDNAAIRQAVVCGTTGSCNKLRLGVRNFAFAANVKMALYDASNNKLGQGTVLSAVTTSGSWLEVALDTPVSVTASTTYRIGAVTSSAGIQPGYLNASGNALIDFGVTYAGFPTDPFSGANNVTWTFAVGMGVI